eukprot:c8814_g1_i1.p1 GENE.c8814_g1_i1~~c8814_g1_i1.p1  ORF type:complete len:294 (+),score=55.16 c8814_g1_i1:47-928(+)
MWTMQRFAPLARTALSNGRAHVMRTAQRSYQAGVQPAQNGTLRAVVGAGAAAGIFAVCVMGQQANENSAGWQDYVTQRVSATYGHFGAGLAVTAASTYYMMRSGSVMRFAASNPMTFAFGGLAVTIGSMILTRSIPYENYIPKTLSLSVFNASIAASLVPAFTMAGPLAIRAAAYTGGVIGFLSLVALSAKSDEFLSWGQPLALGLGVIVVTSFGRFFLPARFLLAHSAMESAVMYGGLILFSGFVMYDTQKIVHKAKYNQQYDPINESLHIYLDAVNLFQYILMFLQSRQRK